MLGPFVFHNHNMLRRRRRLDKNSYKHCAAAPRRLLLYAYKKYCVRPKKYYLLMNGHCACSFHSHRRQILRYLCLNKFVPHTWFHFLCACVWVSVQWLSRCEATIHICKTVSGYTKKNEYIKIYKILFIFSIIPCWSTIFFYIWCFYSTYACTYFGMKGGRDINLLLYQNVTQE